MNRLRASPCLPRERRPRLGVALGVLALLLVGGTLRAEEPALEDGGRFEVRSAFLEPAEHVYQLNATLGLVLSRNFQQAVREGVPVSIELDISVDRKRRYLPDQQAAQLVQRWQIHYHALSERYLVNNLNSGQQNSYATLDAALAALSQVRGLPVVDESLIQKGERYEGSLRVVATVEGGLPSALKFMMFWIDWKRSTDWYTWSVLP
jgi:Domain of unknown function (DUF4390)